MLGAVLWTAGTVGVVSAVPFLSGLTPDVGVSSWSLRLSLPLGLLTLAVLIGVILAPRVALGTPVLVAALSHGSVSRAFAPLLLPGLLGGVAGFLALVVLSGTFAASLPEEFAQSAANIQIPLYARVLYGGITEEVVLRFGLMTLLVWMPYRMLNRAEGEVHRGYFVFGGALGNHGGARHLTGALRGAALRAARTAGGSRGSAREGR